MHAQRRPGPRPRQHPAVRQRPCQTMSRSTKAGASTPATLATFHAACVRDIAQRWPGPRPRQHGRRGAWPQRVGNAQRRPGPRPRQHAGSERGEIGIFDRSTKAGASTPATPSESGRICACTVTLNEGRGLDPGNTAGESHVEPPSRDAQRRPGPRPRQHWRAAGSPRRCRRTLNEGRGLDPGNTAGSERGEIGIFDRSTKAGASTPATPPPDTSPAPPATTLNEGRGLDPGNTCHVTTVPTS